MPDQTTSSTETSELDEASQTRLRMIAVAIVFLFFIGFSTTAIFIAVKAKGDSKISLKLTSSDYLGGDHLMIQGLEVDSKVLKSAESLLTDEVIRTSPASVSHELRREATLLHLENSNHWNKKAASISREIIANFPSKSVVSDLTASKELMLEDSRKSIFHSSKNELYALCVPTVEKFLKQEKINGGKIMKSSNVFSVLNPERIADYYTYCGVTDKEEQAELDKFYAAEIQEQIAKFSTNETELNEAIELHKRAANDTLTETDIATIESQLNDMKND